MIRTTSIMKTALPERSPYGILSPAVTLVHETGHDWTSGFHYETPEGRVNVENKVIMGGPFDASSTVVTSKDDPNFRIYYPFDIQASVRATTFGTTIEEVQRSADVALEVVTQKAIEKEFWTGELAKQLTDDNDNRYLSDASAVDLTPTPGTPVKARYGLALLEQAIGNATIGAEGTIHAPLLIASVLPVGDHDGALKTQLGTNVIAGSGYSNIGPNGTVAPTNQAWMYATGPVTVHLGKTPTLTPEIISQAIEVERNVVEFYVDRPAAVTWSTSYLFAVLVDLNLDYA